MAEDFKFEIGYGERKTYVTLDSDKGEFNMIF